jgi:UDP-galactopyranose mutase
MTPAAPTADIIAMTTPGERRDPIVCLSHLRWDFVFQRPQHLMSRFAGTRPVVFFEEPLAADPGATLGVDQRVCRDTGVIVATPRLPEGLEGACRDAVLRQLLDETLEAHAIVRPVLWYYTPMMLPLSRHIEAAAVVYDCMDELANFRFAPPELTRLEGELMSAADVVFTGGHSLYEAKRSLHGNIHPFPSSVDRAHFSRARLPGDQDLSGPRRPRLGFYGVIDERMDLDLIAAIADARPDWSLILVGPVVKIAEADLPRRDNLIVGAGFAGCVLAERLPAAAASACCWSTGAPHIGGNAYDCLDAAGVLIHRYGPHIFHTNSERGARLSVAIHRVAPLRAPGAGPGRRHAGAHPINLTTLNQALRA